MIPLPELGPPPRDVPQGVQLLVLVHRDVAGTLWMTMPAAAALLFSVVARPPMPYRIGFTVIGALLMVPALKMGFSALLRALRTLHHMRFGHVAIGRIVACKIAGDWRGMEKPYGEFIANYAAMLAASSLSRALGCLFWFFFLGFALPMAGLFLVVIAKLAWEKGIAPFVEAALPQVNFAYVAAFIAVLAVAVAIGLGIRALWRAAAVSLMDDYLETQKQLDIENAPDEYTRQMMVAAQEEARALGLKDLLPPPDQDAIELICNVEYSVSGELHKARGRAFLSSRLKISGVVPLLFDPLDYREVQLFPGLPAVVSCKDGAWQPLPLAANAIGLAVIALVPAAAIGALAAQLLSFALARFG